METLKLKLERDQARAVREQFMPYMEMLCETRLKDNRENVDAYLSLRAVRSLFLEVVHIFDRKLLNATNNLSFALSFAQALCMHELLMQLPINGKEIYLINLRNYITTHLHQQMCEP